MVTPKCILFGYVVVMIVQSTPVYTQELESSLDQIPEYEDYNDVPSYEDSIQYDAPDVKIAVSLKDIVDEFSSPSVSPWTEIFSTSASTVSQETDTSLQTSPSDDPTQEEMVTESVSSSSETSTVGGSQSHVSEGTGITEETAGSEPEVSSKDSGDSTTTSSVYEETVTQESESTSLKTSDFTSMTPSFSQTEQLTIGTSDEFDATTSAPTSDSTFDSPEPSNENSDYEHTEQESEPSEASDEHATPSPVRGFVTRNECSLPTTLLLSVVFYYL